MTSAEIMKFVCQSWSCSLGSLVDPKEKKYTFEGVAKERVETDKYLQMIENAGAHVEFRVRKTGEVVDYQLIDGKMNTGEFLKHAEDVAGVKRTNKLTLGGMARPSVYERESNVRKLRAKELITFMNDLGIGVYLKDKRTGLYACSPTSCAEGIKNYKKHWYSVHRTIPVSMNEDSALYMYKTEVFFLERKTENGSKVDVCYQPRAQRYIEKNGNIPYDFTQ